MYIQPRQNRVINIIEFLSSFTTTLTSRISLFWIDTLNKFVYKGLLSYFLWLSIFRFLANLSVVFHKKWVLGPIFDGESIGPVTGPLAQLFKSDFDSITSYGSAQVSAAQICKNFENRYVRTRDMGKKLTKNGHFWAQFWPNSCPV